MMRSLVSGIVGWALVDRSNRSAMRSVFVVRDQDGKARLAAAIAAHASSTSPSLTRPNTSPVVGLCRSNSSVPCGSTNRPSM
jgi:hypothetical protein